MWVWVWVWVWDFLVIAHGVLSSFSDEALRAASEVVAKVREGTQELRRLRAEDGAFVLGPPELGCAPHPDDGLDVRGVWCPAAVWAVVSVSLHVCRMLCWPGGPLSRFATRVVEGRWGGGCTVVTPSHPPLWIACVVWVCLTTALKLLLQTVELNVRLQTALNRSARVGM